MTLQTLRFRPLIRGLSISSPTSTASITEPDSFRPLIRGLSISSFSVKLYRTSDVSFRPLIRGLSISSSTKTAADKAAKTFPSPHPGIINFFFIVSLLIERAHRFPSLMEALGESSDGFLSLLSGHIGFRPLIRGLSISSHYPRDEQSLSRVSVPSSGDYQFLQVINQTDKTFAPGFRPLIRGLSISSPDPWTPTTPSAVSVPSSGDYQFLPSCTPHTRGEAGFPSPHPGIINFFTVTSFREKAIAVFPSPHPGIINFFLNRKTDPGIIS